MRITTVYEILKKKNQNRFRMPLTGLEDIGLQKRNEETRVIDPLWNL
jgi:hypothetical protein